MSRDELKNGGIKAATAAVPLSSSFSYVDGKKGKKSRQKVKLKNSYWETVVCFFSVGGDCARRLIPREQ